MSAGLSSEILNLAAGPSWCHMNGFLADMALFHMFVIWVRKGEAAYSTSGRSSGFANAF